MELDLWPVRRGIARLLWADGQYVILRDVAGGVVCLAGHTGEETFALDFPEGIAAISAVRSGDVLHLVSARGVERGVPYGQEVHHRATEFGVWQLQLPQGRVLQRSHYGHEGAVMAGPPLTAGGALIERTSAPARVWMAGRDPRTMHRIFEVEFEGPRRPEAVPLLVAPDRLIVGSGGRVLAFPGVADLRLAVVRGRGPRQAGPHAHRPETRDPEGSPDTSADP
jgi:hypothetical protein